MQDGTCVHVIGCCFFTAGPAAGRAQLPSALIAVSGSPQSVNSIWIAALRSLAEVSLAEQPAAWPRPERSRELQPRAAISRRRTRAAQSAHQASRGPNPVNLGLTALPAAGRSVDEAWGPPAPPPLLQEQPALPGRHCGGGVATSGGSRRPPSPCPRLIELPPSLRAPCRPLSSPTRPTSRAWLCGSMSGAPTPAAARRNSTAGALRCRPALPPPPSHACSTMPALLQALHRGHGCGAAAAMDGRQPLRCGAAAGGQGVPAGGGEQADAVRAAGSVGVVLYCIGPSARCGRHLWRAPRPPRSGHARPARPQSDPAPRACTGLCRASGRLWRSCRASTCVWFVWSVAVQRALRHARPPAAVPCT